MRKQLLLGTTALLAGAVAMPDYVSAEDPLRLSVRGYKNEYFGVGDVDDQPGTNFGNTSHFSDGEVHFKGETDLDNGLTIGVHAELELDGSTSDDIDEAYTYVSGNFGRVVIGGENLAPYTTFWGVTAPNVGVPINSGWISSWVPVAPGTGLGFTSPGFTTNITQMNDNFGISYISPRFAGFQFTAGYAPTSGSESNRGDGSVTSANTNETLQNHDIIEVGFNWKESFNGVDLGLAAGWGRASVNDRADGLGADDPEQAKVGASIGVAGFSIAGSYANEYEGIAGTTTTAASFSNSAFTRALRATCTGGTVATCTNAQISAAETAATSAGGTTRTTSNEGQSWDIGATYGMGPWGVSGTWFHGEEEDTLVDPDDDEVDAIVGAVSYSIGPGITTSFSVIYAEFETEADVSSEGTMGILGLAIGF